jgi:cyclic pyranopterin phosphate synthase
MTEKSQPSLTHLDAQGQAQIVDITDRDVTHRTARVTGRVLISQAVVDLIAANGISKGNVLEIARIAGIMGAKKTSELIPLCHPIAITE